MERYRGLASFRVEEMAHFLEPHLDLRNAMFEELRAHPELRQVPLGEDAGDMDAHRERLFAQVQEAARWGLNTQNPAMSGDEFKSQFRAIFGAIRTASPMWPVSFGLHMMFAGVVESLGTAKHAAFFPTSPQIRDFSVFGCFALTELTHGTNVQGMQTQAVLKREGGRSFFHLFSPRNSAGTPVASKWWVGNAGKHATHAVVGAMLIDMEGKNHGLHFFLVQLRDTKTMQLRPGVVAGDIGPKPGQQWLSMDNGFIYFDCELSVDALLDKYQRVSAESGYEVLVDPRKRFGLTLGALSSGRVNITNIAASTLREVMLISIRYSAQRIQFSKPSSQEEDPVLEYPLQQVRLLPFLAGAYTFRFFSAWLMEAFDECTSRAGETSQDFLDLNAELHAISCGAKALTTWYTFSAIQESRLACGGHGFSHFSGIPQLRDVHDPSQTYEGDNYVLLQQLQRYLLQAVQAGNFSSPLGSLEVLRNVQNEEASSSSWDGQDVAHLNVQAALEARVCYLVRTGGAKLAADMATFSGSGKMAFKDHAWTTWNKSQPQYLQEAAVAFMECLVHRKAGEAIERAPASLQPVLRQMHSLFGLQVLLKGPALATLLESGYFSPTQSRAVREGMVKSCAELKDDAVALVDAYAPPEDFIHSALAKDHYEDHLFNHVKHLTQRISYWKNRAPVQFMSKGNIVQNALDRVQKTQSKL